MKSLFVNIKNLIPYLFLIFIYFFFVNIEARKNLDSTDTLKDNNNEQKTIDSKNNKRIQIPVIPYD